MDYLTSPEGLPYLILTLILTILTAIFYVLTGCTDPGFVRNQIFENHYETTELVEEELNYAAVRDSSKINQPLSGQL